MVVDYRMVNKILCLLEGGYRLFQKCVNLDAQKQCTGLGKGKDKSFTKTLYAWDPGLVAQLVGALSHTPKGVVLIPSQGT